MLCLVSCFIYCYAECHYDKCRNSVCRYAKCRNSECRYAECHYAECHYAECHYAECRGARNFVPFLFLTSADPYSQPLVRVFALSCRQRHNIFSGVAEVPDNDQDCPRKDSIVYLKYIWLRPVACTMLLQ